MIDAGVRELVRRRAGNCCEYCLLPQQHSPLAVLQIEHVIPKKHGGDDDFSNLALACITCNLAKGPNLTGLHPETNAITALFNPRRHQWSDHFRWTGVRIDGKTDTGKVTVRVLNFNSDIRIQLRLATGYHEA